MKTTRPTLQVRKEAIEKSMARAGLNNTKLAALMQIDRSNLSRTLNGRLLPGNQFVASMCMALEKSPNDLFVIVEPDEERAA